MKKLGLTLRKFLLRSKIGCTLHNMEQMMFGVKSRLNLYNWTLPISKRSIPLLLRDGSGDSVHSAGVVWLSQHVPTQDDTNKVQGENHKQTDAGYSNL